MNHGADDKIAPQLDGMCLPRLCADHRYPSRKCLEHWAGTVHGFVSTRGHGPEPALPGYTRPAKHWRCHKIDASLGVLHGEPLTERHADGAARDVQAAR